MGWLVISEPERETDADKQEEGKRRGPVSRNYTSLEFGISTALELFTLLRYAKRANKLSHDFNMRQ